MSDLIIHARSEVLPGVSTLIRRKINPFLSSDARSESQNLRNAVEF